MALGGGPAADAPVGVDVIAAVAQPRVALKALRKEIAAAEKELAQLVRDGGNITAKASDLKKLETQYKQVALMDKNARAMAQRSKQAIALGKLANAAMTAQAIGNIVRGGFDAQSTFTLAAMAMQHEKAISKAFGAKGLEFVQRIGPVIPMVGAGLSSVLEGMRESRRLRDDMSSMGAAFQQGKLSKAQELYAQQVFTETWFEDPKATIAAAEKMGKAIGNIPAHKLREVLSKTKVVFSDKFTYMHNGNIEEIEEKALSIDPDDFMSQYERGVSKERERLGRSMTQAEQMRVLLDTVADYGRERKWTAKQLQDYSAQLEKSDSLAIAVDTGHRMKFMNDLRLQQEAARLRARHIPARLEY